MRLPVVGLGFRVSGLGSYHGDLRCVSLPPRHRPRYTPDPKTSNVSMLESLETAILRENMPKARNPYKHQAATSQTLHKPYARRNHIQKP